MPLKTGIVDLLPKLGLARICQLRELYFTSKYAWIYAGWQMNQGGFFAVNITVSEECKSPQDLVLY